MSRRRLGWLLAGFALWRLATLLALVSFVSISLRRERRSSHSNASV